MSDLPPLRISNQGRAVRSCIWTGLLAGVALILGTLFLIFGTFRGLNWQDPKEYVTVVGYALLVLVVLFLAYNTAVTDLVWLEVGEQLTARRLLLRSSYSKADIKSFSFVNVKQRGFAAASGWIVPYSMGIDRVCILRPRTGREMRLRVTQYEEIQIRKWLGVYKPA